MPPARVPRRTATSMFRRKEATAVTDPKVIHGRAFRVLVKQLVLVQGYTLPKAPITRLWSPARAAPLPTGLPTYPTRSGARSLILQDGRYSHGKTLVTTVTSKALIFAVRVASESASVVRLRVPKITMSTTGHRAAMPIQL